MLLNYYHKIIYNIHMSTCISIYLCIHIQPKAHIAHIGLGTISDWTLQLSATTSMPETIGPLQILLGKANKVGDRGRKGSIKT